MFACISVCDGVQVVVLSCDGLDESSGGTCLVQRYLSPQVSDVFLQVWLAVEHMRERSPDVPSQSGHEAF